MKPSALAAELGCTPALLHKLCVEHDLERLARGRPGAKRKTYDFPAETIARLREIAPTCRKGKKREPIRNRS